MLEISVSQQDIEVFFLVLVRMASFVSVVPFYGESNIPVRYKLGFAVALSYIVYSLMPIEELPYSTTLEYATLVVKESIEFIARPSKENKQLMFKRPKFPHGFQGRMFKGKFGGSAAGGVTFL